MPKYVCKTKCHHGAGRARKLYEVGDTEDFAEGAEVPRHFVPVEQFTPPELPVSDADPVRQQFGSVRAPDDPDYEHKQSRAKKPAGTEGKQS